MMASRFLYIGAPKSGSTWLFDALMEQPDVEVYSGKYIHYFKDYYKRGGGWYEGHFRRLQGTVASGDFDTTYMFNKSVMERVSTDYPDMKLIVSLRNPVERDWSAFQFLKSNGQLPRDVSLVEAYKKNIEFLSDCGKYGEGLQFVFELFPAENVLVLWYDELRNNPARYFQRVQKFLSADSEFKPLVLHQVSYKTKVARFATLNVVLKYISRLLHALGLARVVMSVKRSALINKVIFVPDKKRQRDKPSRADRELILSMRIREIEMLESLLGEDLRHWKSIEN